jgi:hypothetical protein
MLQGILSFSYFIVPDYTMKFIAYIISENVYYHILAQELCTLSIHWAA